MRDNEYAIRNLKLMVEAMVDLGIMSESFATRFIKHSEPRVAADGNLTLRQMLPARFIEAAERKNLNAALMEAFHSKLKQWRSKR